MTDNGKGLEIYKHISKSIDNPKVIRLKGNTTNDEAIGKDAAFIRKFGGPDIDLLDIGSGTGLIINQIIPDFRTISCVEYFKEFSDYIIKSTKIKIFNYNITNMEIDEIYHVITGFGVFHYFSANDVLPIYARLCSLLAESGVLIIKNQFSLGKDDLVIDGYSEELEQNYYSCYRTLKNEEKLLRDAGFAGDITVTDIYPPQYNRWDNSHFYALTIKK